MQAMKRSEVSSVDRYRTIMSFMEEHLIPLLELSHAPLLRGVFRVRVPTAARRGAGDSISTQDSPGVAKRPKHLPIIIYLRHSLKHFLFG